MARGMVKFKTDRAENRTGWRNGKAGKWGKIGIIGNVVKLLKPVGRSDGKCQNGHARIAAQMVKCQNMKAGMGRNGETYTPHFSILIDFRPCWFYRLPVLPIYRVSA